MTWIKACAYQIAIARGVKRPSKKDLEKAKAFFNKVNESRVNSGLEPYIN